MAWNFFRMGGMVITCISDANINQISLASIQKRWTSILHKSFLIPSLKLLNFEHSLYLPPSVTLLSLTTCAPKAEGGAEILPGSHVPHTPPCQLKDVLLKLSFISDLVHNYSTLASCQVLCSVLFCIFSYLDFPPYSLQWHFLLGFNIELYL